MIAFTCDGLDPRGVLAIVAEGAGGLGEEVVPARPAFAGNPPKILDEKAQFRWLDKYRFGHEGVPTQMQRPAYGAAHSWEVVGSMGKSTHIIRANPLTSSLAFP